MHTSNGWMASQQFETAKTEVLSPPHADFVSAQPSASVVTLVTLRPLTQSCRTIERKGRRNRNRNTNCGAKIILSKGARCVCALCGRPPPSMTSVETTFTLAREADCWQLRQSTATQHYVVRTRRRWQRATVATDVHNLALGKTRGRSFPRNVVHLAPLAVHRCRFCLESWRACV